MSTPKKLSLRDKLRKLTNQWAKETREYNGDRKKKKKIKQRKR